ncbi:MAG: hypothetical protein QM612_03395 [Thermomonas sp.]|uniref:hypothetical protein n=1 Tax=Thermomonas sp. TaxID=1971895 RepID=UPI0039E5D0A8
MQVIVGLFFLIAYLTYTTVAAIPAFLIARFMPASWPWLRYLSSIAAFTLLAAPSLGSATIATVPAPFAVYAIVAIFTLDSSGMIWALQAWPWWHAVSFPITLLVALLAFRRLRPNNSFKPTPLRGAA